MTMPTPNDLKIVSTGERCRWLLSKGMYINAGLPPGEEAIGDGYFWCGQTQIQWGPDQQICDNAECHDPTRSCYEAP